VRGPPALLARALTDDCPAGKGWSGDDDDDENDENEGAVARTLPEVLARRRTREQRRGRSRAAGPGCIHANHARESERMLRAGRGV
jgi:hypothetical protein